MSMHIVIREYATLKKGNQQILNNTLDTATIPASAFDWLEEKAEEEAWQGILKFKNSTSLVIRQYVGYLETPCGLGIEILPKSTHVSVDDANTGYQQSRDVLWNLLSQSLNIKPRQTSIAALRERNQPIHEWIFTQFLYELKWLILQGIRNDYERVDEESRFIRGQLDINRQILNNAACKKMHFHINHDIYTSNRVENRLLATALRMILRLSRQKDNRQMAHELASYFIDIPSETYPEKSWPKWQKSRLLLHYETIKTWCQLILFGQNPEWMKGERLGMALLFDMNRLFEAYVSQCLSTVYQVKSQASSRYLLVNHAGSHFFKLIPDLILNQRIVADCKWKLLNHQQVADGKKAAFALHQGDLYQLGMHGMNYLPSGQGQLILFYPENSQFDKPLFFQFSHDSALHLMVIPFPLMWNRENSQKVQNWIKQVSD